MGTRSPWVVLGVALAFLLGLAACRGEGEAQRPGALPVPVRVAKVREGAIRTTVAFSGSVQAKDQVELMAGASGKIEQVSVEVGSAVRRGEPIAQLETDTLQVALKQAEANLQSAQAQLNTVLAGARPEQAAAAKATLEAARIRLEHARTVAREAQISSAEASVARARTRLEDLRAGAKAADLASAKAQVDIAAATLEREEARLHQLQNPTPADIQAAQAALENARATLAAAEVRRDGLEADTATAQATVDSARAAVTNAEIKLEDLLHPDAATLSKAEADVEAARSTLEQTQAKYERLIVGLSDKNQKFLFDAYLEWWNAKRRLDDDLARGAPQAVLDKDREELLRALSKVQAAERDYNLTNPGVNVQDYLSTVAALASAKAALASAEARLAELKNPPANDIRAAQSTLDSAWAAFRSAEAKLRALSGPGAEEAAARRAAVVSARAAVASAEAKLNQLKHPTAADIEAAQAAVATAQANRDAAQARWDQLRAGATAADLQGAESDLVRAQNDFTLARSDADLRAQEQQVAQLEQQAALAENPYTSNDLRRVAAALAVAEAQVEQARLALAKATVTAPFDAIVAKKYLSEGALASASSPIVSLVSSSAELTFNVEEAALGQVRAGQQVSFTVPAYGERPFRGQVTTIAPIADPASRTFLVKVVPEDPQGQLRAGMFANLQVLVAGKERALLAPRAAVVQRPDGPVVFVVKDDKTELRKVRLGLSGETDAEVLEGVTAGEDLVVQGNRTLRGNDTVRVTEDRPAGGSGPPRSGGQGQEGGRPGGR